VAFAPTGSPLTVDEKLEGLARLAQTGGVSRFAVANPAGSRRTEKLLKRSRGSAAYGTPLARASWLGDTISQAERMR
jgi:hypothetical protein